MDTKEMYANESFAVVKKRGFGGRMFFWCWW